MNAYSSVGHPCIINVNGVPFYMTATGQLVQVPTQSQSQYVQVVLPQQLLAHGQGPAYAYAQHQAPHQGYSTHYLQTVPQKQFVAPMGFSQTSYTSGPAGRYIPGLHVTTCLLSRVIPTTIGEHDLIYVRSAGPGWVEVKFGSITGFMQV